jgi:hypothetical protein
MKKIVFIFVIAFTLVMCKSSKTTTGSTKKADTEVKYRDDFRSASAAERTALLKSLKATAANYSVLVLTQNYKGEKITVSNATTTKLYSDYVISNLKTGIAATTRIDNTVDTKIYDDLTKTEVVIKAKDAQKHKYIYVMKKPGEASPFLVTYSNTLRPLK